MSGRAALASHTKLCYGKLMMQAKKVTYEIALARAKENSIRDIIKKRMPSTIEPYDIIPLLNTAWGQSFGRPVSNRKVIADRGWNTLNRNILLNSTLRSTIAKTERDTESTRTLVLSKILTLTPSTSTTLANYTTASTPVVSIAIVPFNNPRFDPTFLLFHRLNRAIK